MKSFFISLLPLVQAIRYSKYIQERVSCQTPIRYFLQVSLGLSLDGNQGKLSKSVYQLLLLMTLWRSPDALTVIQPLRLKFSNLRDRWLSNKKPLTLLSTVEGQPLRTVKAIGAIQMLDNFIKPVNKTDVLLHIFKGV